MHKAFFPIMVIITLVVVALWGGTRPMVITAADDSYPYPTPTEPPENTPAPLNPTSPTNTTPTVTVVATMTATLIATTEDETTNPVFAESATATMVVDTPTATSLPRPSANQQVLDCQAGDQRVVQGKTTPNTLLLLYFSGRVVGGGMSDTTGFYEITLTMGNESLGIHPLLVTKRLTGQIIARHYCVVESQP